MALKQFVGWVFGLGLGLSLSICLVFTSGGCARDRSLDDWKREKLEEDLAKLQSADGRYSGFVKSRRDGGEVLGALQLTLKAQLRTGASGGTSGVATDKTDAKPLLTGSVEFFGDKHVGLVIADSYYDPLSHQYQANIPVVTEGGRAEQVSLSGLITDYGIEGSVEAFGYPDFGGVFLLQKDAPVPRPTAWPSSRPMVGATSVYRGDTSFAAVGARLPVELIMLDPSKSPEEDFLGIFFPIKNLQISFNYGGTVRLLHNAARWDKRTLSMMAKNEVTLNGFKALVTTECKELQGTAQAAQAGFASGWSCDHFTVDGGLVGHTEVSSSKEAPGGSEPPPQAQDAITAHFIGQADLGDGSGGLTPAKLFVLQPAKSREEYLSELFFPPYEKYLQVTLQFFEDHPMIFLFDRARLDARTGTLTGAAQMTIDGKKFDLTLKCKDFYFTSQRDAFSCQYLSNNLGREIGIKFWRR